MRPHVFTLLLMLMLCGTASARKPLSKRPEIDFFMTNVYELPADTCEYAVTMLFAHNLLRSRETLTVKFQLLGPEGQYSKPGTMLIEGNAASRRSERKLRHAGQPVPESSSGKARRNHYFRVVFTMLIPDKQPWMDEATGVRITQTLQRGNHTETLPEKTKQLNHLAGYNPDSRTHSARMALEKRDAEAAVSN